MLFTQTVKKIPAIQVNRFSDEQLEAFGWYRGFPCVHGHTVRDKEEHYCVQCVQKIQMNVAGADVNYINDKYMASYAKLLGRVSYGDPLMCWSYDGPSRCKMPNYAAVGRKNQSENVGIAKAMYQLFWGDVGNCRVSRICDDPHCCNPLHYETKFHTRLAPKTLKPCELELKAAKRMHYMQLEREGRLEDYLRLRYRNSITNPLEVGEEPEYHES